MHEPFFRPIESFLGKTIYCGFLFTPQFSVWLFCDHTGRLFGQMDKNVQLNLYNTFSLKINRHPCDIGHPWPPHTSDVNNQGIGWGHSLALTKTRHQIFV